MNETAEAPRKALMSATVAGLLGIAAGTAFQRRVDRLVHQEQARLDAMRQQLRMDRLNRQLNRDVNLAGAMGRNVGPHLTGGERDQAFNALRRGRIAIGATPQGPRHASPAPRIGGRQFERDFVGRREDL